MRKKLEVDSGQPRVMNLVEFCARYKIGRSKAYLEIKAKRLKARKCGDRLLIADDDAEDWLDALPVLGAVLSTTRPHRGKPATRRLGGMS